MTTYSKSFSFSSRPALPASVLHLLVALMAAPLGCASEASPGSSGSSGGADQDAATGADGGVISPGSDAGSDAATTPQGIQLTLGGSSVAIDPASVNAGTLSDFNGTVWVTSIHANIVGGENLAFNTEKLPLTITIHDETTRKSPMPLGNFACIRGPFGEATYGFTDVTIYAVKADGEHPLLTLVEDDPSCKTHFDQWSKGYRGSLTGQVKSSNSKTALPITVQWNIPQGGK